MDSTRRKAIGLGVTAAIGSAAFGVALAGQKRVATAGIPQGAASYQTEPVDNQRCAVCAHFLPPGACQVVQGTVVANGWCKLFRSKTA
jgi:hypothetical protein